MNVVRWEAPPREGAYRTRQDWPGIAAALMKRPDRWAVVLVADSMNYAGGVASRIRAGSYTAMRPAGAFDACARMVDGECRVYARYVGEDGVS